MPTSPWLERAIQTVAPRYALQRQLAHARLHALGGMQAAMGGYDSTQGTDRFMGRLQHTPRSADADTLRHITSQRGQSRDLVRNNPIAASAINTNVVRAIGTGLAYSAQPHLATLGWTPEQGDAWRRQAQAEFSLWADSPQCDWDGQLNFYAKQDLTARSMLESGDVFTLLPAAAASAAMPYTLRLQTLEADRVGNPGGVADNAEVAGGVRRGAGGLLAFHLYATHPGSGFPQANRFKGEWVDAVGTSGRHRMLQHMQVLRPDQRRGVPYLAPVVALFKLLGTYTDAEVKAAVVSAYTTLIIETESGNGTAPIFGMDEASAAGPADASGQHSTDVQMGPAAVLNLASGEKANFVNPLRPNPEFAAFVQAVLDQLGAGLFIGSEMLMKKYNTSYVAARAAYLDAWKHLLNLRTLIARSYCQPILETWMAEAVFLGRLQAPGFFADPRMRWAYTRAAWRGDSPGSINPRDEVTAWVTARDARLTTNEHASWELYGTDWNDSYPVMRTEHQQMAADGMLPVPKAGAAAPQPAAPAGAPTNP